MRVVLFLLKCIVGLFAAIGALVVAVAVFAVIGLSEFEPLTWEPREVEVPSATVLTLDLASGLVEDLPDNPLARASLSDALVLRETLDALAAAGSDSRVKGLVMRLGRGELGFADAQELRDAILAFRADGKFAVAFAESFGEGGNGTLHYYLASAFDKIWLQPSGMVDLIGLQIESPFLREALDELGIDPQLDQRAEYKGMMNTFTDRRLPRPQRENLQRLADSWLDQIVSGVAGERGLEATALHGLIDQAPFLADQALSQRLIDDLGYWDQTSNDALAQAGDDAAFLSLADYASAMPAAEGPVIALVYGLGPVVLGGGDNNPFYGPVVMGSDAVAEAIADAVADTEVEAILFRVDSPGGSYVAADTIWREVQQAGEAQVPVVVTMGNVAASGGYFVAAPAHKIVAQPATLTGSIGVVGGKLVLRELWDKLGIGWDGVQAGANADFWSMNQPYSTEGWQHLQRILDAVYSDFTGKVAEGRGLDAAATERAAKGQVFTGADAKELGLVDEIGGYRTALALAREAAGIDADAPVEIRVFPRERDPFEALFEDFLGTSAEGPGMQALVRTLARVAQLVAPLAQTLDGLSAQPQGPQLRAPDVRLAN